MSYLNKLERKFGRFAIPNLSIWLIGGYLIGYLLEFAAPGLLDYLTLEPYYILHGQVWRLITWVLMPPSGGISGMGLIFAVIMMVFYYQLGTALERTWGTFRFNVYIWGGILFTILGSFILYGALFLIEGGPVAGIGSMFSTAYINESIFLAFALCYPEMQVMLYFIIPVKMKWMGIFYGVIIILELLTSNWAVRVAIIMSLLNFLIFYFSTRNYNRLNPKQIRRRQAFKAQTKTSRGGGSIAKHKCAICGRTELDDPTLEFRFCSKCEGNYEYCQEHLFTHEHRKRS